MPAHNLRILDDQRWSELVPQGRVVPDIRLPDLRVWISIRVLCGELYSRTLHSSLLSAQTPTALHGQEGLGRRDIGGRFCVLHLLIRNLDVRRADLEGKAIMLPITPVLQTCEHVQQHRQRGDTCHTVSHHCGRQYKSRLQNLVRKLGANLQRPGLGASGASIEQM